LHALRLGVFPRPLEPGRPAPRAAPLTPRLFGRFKEDPTWGKLWYEDLRYQKACDYFDGRKPPRHDRLARFAPDREAAATYPGPAPERVPASS